ncbi:MAG: hypothetical protein PWQ20_1493 [Thermotogaceae bacterium]|nr:hypothetical protein [Thermotogaceae bacterium]
MKKYYFAYGSNMCLDQMRVRCPDSEFLKVVKLEGYKFVYDGYSRSRKSLVGNIVKNEGTTVYGALFEISEEDEESLDRYEGFPYAYNKTTVKVKDEEDNEYDALVYLRQNKKEGIPSIEYENILVKAAYELGLPYDYVEKYLKGRKNET